MAGKINGFVILICVVICGNSGTCYEYQDLDVQDEEAEPLEDSTGYNNVSKSNKDMYIINAMVYQVGILTNKTDDTLRNSTGNQETITFYHNNGTNLNLDSIPPSLLTNVTAQSFVGVAPMNDSYGAPVSNIPWSALQQLVSTSELQANESENSINRQLRNVDFIESVMNNNKNGIYVKKNTENWPVKIDKGSAVIPEEAGVQSVLLPPLLALNNNFTDIPVPIPNTSIVHYAKLNTLVQMPNSSSLT